MIELSNITKKFHGHMALDDVDLFIQEGEIFGIIGQSGAGKSTLLRTINLLEHPDKGDVMLDGDYLTRMSVKKLRHARQKSAMIFQHFNLLSSQTAFNNIALPMRIQGIAEDTIKEKVAELLKLVNLEDKAQAYPSELSGGQKQRVSIARALSTSPKVLLCDEATSALDPQTTAVILDLLKKINKQYGITIVLITHEMEVIKRICHRLSVMESGKIIETTSLSRTLDDPDSIARKMLFSGLNPKLPDCILKTMVDYPTTKPIIRLYFQGECATGPFLSQTSQDLKLNINILLANIDRFDDIICGIVVIELLDASPLLSETFQKRCVEAGLTVEVLGHAK